MFSIFILKRKTVSITAKPVQYTLDKVTRQAPQNRPLIT